MLCILILCVFFLLSSSSSRYDRLAGIIFHGSQNVEKYNIDGLTSRTEIGKRKKRTRIHAYIRTAAQRVLLIDGVDRTINNLQFLRSLCENVVFFEKFVLNLSWKKNEDEEWADISKLLQYKRVEMGQSVFNQGDKSDAAYIILDGEVSIHFSDVINRVRKTKTLGLLYPGDSFNELTLICPEYEQTFVTATANKRTDLITINKDAYLAFAKKWEFEKTINKTLSFLKSFEVFGAVIYYE